MIGTHNLAPAENGISLDSYRQELEVLVNIDSGTADIAGVATMAEQMAEKYRAIGWYVEQANLGPAVGPGLMATNKPGAAQYDVLLVGHLDTVFPHGMAAARPFSVEGDIARGPGVADMKSGLLSMFYALKHLDAATLERLAIVKMLGERSPFGNSNRRQFVTLGAVADGVHRGEGGLKFGVGQNLAVFTKPYTGLL